MCRLCLAIAVALAAPLLVETDGILSAWLRTPPASASTFCWALLLMYLVDTSSAPVSIAIQASGRIARLQSICGIINLATVPAPVTQPFVDKFKANGMKLKETIRDVFKSEDFTKF